MDFTIIINSVRDLVKYHAIRQINTGDKTIDNIAITLVVSIMAILFTRELWVKLYAKISSRFCRKNREITVKLAKEMMADPDNNFKEIRWNAGLREEITMKLVKFMNQKQDEGVFKSPDNGYYSNITNTDTAVVYISDTKCKYQEDAVIGLKVKGEMIFLIYRERKILDEFIGLVESVVYPPKPSETQITTRKIFFTVGGDTFSTILFPEHTFSRFVSRHKPLILNAIRNFNLANEGKFPIGGFGSYNLGIMLYGKPGTGKTQLIKIICNTLQRDAKVVDMRNVRTRKDFYKIFSNDNTYDGYTRLVYVLDEFDCVKDVIQSRDNEAGHKKTDVDSLRDHLVKLIGMKNPDKVNHDLDEQIETTKRQMSNVENSLTIDTVLTILDGMCEYRGRVIIATTNYINRIDSALLRPGRFDLKINLTNFNKEEMIELLIMIYSQSDNKSDREKATYEYLSSLSLREDEFTPVELINMCRCSTGLDAVLSNLVQTTSI